MTDALLGLALAPCPDCGAAAALEGESPGALPHPGVGCIVTCSAGCGWRAMQEAAWEPDMLACYERAGLHPTPQSGRTRLL